MPIKETDTTENSEVEVSVAIPAADEEPEESDEITVEDGDTTVTVVNEESGDAVEAVVVEETIDQAVMIANLQRDVIDLSTRIGALEIAAVVEESEDTELDDDIEELAEDMEEIAEDGNEPDSGEIDIMPPAAEPKSAKAHPLFRPFAEWKRD